ncbi:MAG: NAD(P)H-dependent oxidoreductase [Fibrobacterota bacterium]|nr:NAD(P)H-dependent oxidoreductase [Fibrobacterota bacterium]QQS03986.1 MAG: NAD(P)H-dependent oxidoreductase [Fibrobacterota bacterium]
MDTTQMPDTLVVFAHPAFEKSRVHRTWLPEVQALPFVEVRDLCQLYPGGVVDVKAEQAALEAARTVVLQFPLYWYACPGILKEWIDQVFEHGWAYGQAGTALRGKRLVVATSAGGAREAYQAEGRNRHPIKEYLLPHEGLARLCGMDWLGVFALHGALAVRQKQDAQPSAAAYVRLLQGLHDNTLDLARLRVCENILEAIEAA